MDYEYIITARRILCSKCDGEDLMKYGNTPDGRQILKCYNCNKKSTVNVRKYGEQRFIYNKLLPILRKDPGNFSHEELYSLGVISEAGYLSKTGQLTINLNLDKSVVLLTVKEHLQINNIIFQYRNKLRLTWAYKYSIAYWNALGIYTNEIVKMDYMQHPYFKLGASLV